MHKASTAGEDEAMSEKVPKDKSNVNLTIPKTAVYLAALLVIVAVVVGAVSYSTGFNSGRTSTLTITTTSISTMMTTTLIADVPIVPVLNSLSFSDPSAFLFVAFMIATVAVVVTRGR